MSSYTNIFRGTYIAFHLWSVPCDRTAIKKFRGTYCGRDSLYYALLMETIYARQILGMTIVRIFFALISITSATQAINEMCKHSHIKIIIVKL